MGIQREPCRRRRRWSLTWAASWAGTVVAIGFVALSLVLFLWESLPVWRHAGWGFVSGTEWFYRAERFGMLPMLYGSVMVSLVALLLAGPLGIGAALFTAEYVPNRARLAIKAIVELLAGVPSVVYGLLGVLFLRNWIDRLLTPFDPLSGDTLLTAGVLLGVMVLPTFMTLSDDALRGVSAAQRLAGRGLGLTRTETVLGVVLPQAAPGIVAAGLLATGRALGETIAVFLVIGRQDNQLPETPWSLAPLIEAGQTLTSKLGGAETHIAYGDPLHWAAITGLGLVLLVLVVGLTMAGLWLAERSKPVA